MCRKRELWLGSSSLLFSSLLFCCLAALGWTPDETLAAPSPGLWTTLPNDVGTTLGWDLLNGSNQLLPGGKGGATHVALVRGKGDSSWVLHWQHGSMARLWLAKPDLGNVATRDVPLPMSTTEIFCSGHSLMGDGRLCVVGGVLVGDGHHIGQTGTPHTVAFDARSSLATTNWGWSSLDDMDEGRWYPTSTTLGDGRVMASSGTEYFNMEIFGGRTGGGTAVSNEFRPMGRDAEAEWYPDDSQSYQPVTAREGHSFTFIPEVGIRVVFGGLDGSGALVATDPIHVVRRAGVHQGYEWQWQPIPAVADSVNGIPDPRAWHSAVAMGDSLFIFGGQGEYGNPLDDLWLLYNLSGTPQWKKLSISEAPGMAGSGPPRYGHATVLDVRKGSPLLHSLMVMFGGGTTGGVFSDNAVWAIRLPQAGGIATAQWERLISPGPGGPVGRMYHVGIYDGNVRGPEGSRSRRMFFHGGWQPSESPAYRSDTWALSRDDFGDGTNVNWRWNSITFQSGSTIPNGRMRHAAIFDHEWDTFRMFGGALEGGSRTNEQWRFGLGHGVTDSNWTWVQVAQSGTPTARSGHAMIEDPREVLNRVPELFQPSAGGGGSWSTLTGASAGRYFSWYPMLFQLRSGDVFFAGNGHAEVNVTTSAVLDMSSQTWVEPEDSGFEGGSAALYTPLGGHDRVMKCGGVGHVFFEPLAGAIHASGITAVATVDTTDGTTTWDDTPPDMPEPRLYHNLTILPNGQVLMTGGMDDSIDPEDPDPVLTPRLWKPTTSTWHTGDSQVAQDLLPDDEARGYHSIGLLLPDARVLCASGDLYPYNPPAIPPATIFKPPYLFTDTDGNTAVRPVITAQCDSTGYGETFDVQFSGVATINQVCLMRPGSVTHALNMDQRRVELGFSNLSAGKIRVQMATNPNLVPPGDYLVFLLRKGVPSVAHWIRVNDVTAPPPPGNLAQDYSTDDVIVLSWSAPNAGGTCSRGALYDLRWSASQITTEAQFNSAYAVNVGLPQEPGATETAQLNGLSPCTARYFALKTKDLAGHWSVMETTSGTTSCCNFSCLEAVMAGGDEAEVRSGRSGLEAIGAGVGAASVVTQATGEAAGARGFAIERGEGDGASWRIRAMEVEEARGYGADTTGALMVGIVGENGTTALAKVPDLSGAVGVSVALRADRRLIGLGRVGLARIEKSIRSGEAGVASLASAWHSRSGEAVSAVRDSGRVELSPGDTLEIRYTADSSPAAAGTKVSHFLVIDAGAGRATQPEQERGESSVPARFALHQNLPNPFASATTFRFDLPRAEWVTLDVLDVQGRRIARPVNGPYAGGYHSVTWDRRAGAGQASPGVYFYRIVAGSFRDQKKLVVTP